MNAKAMLCNSCPVAGSAIAFILVPMVLRKFEVQGLQVIVPVGFGQNAGCGNAGIRAIALYKALMINTWERFKPVSIYQK